MGQETDNQSTLTIARWTGQDWGERETVDFGQDPAAGSAAALAAAPQTDQLNVLMRLRVWAQDNVSRFEIGTTSRTVTPMAITPIPTYTPLPTTTPIPTPTLLPTATPRPQLTNIAQRPGAGSDGPPPLILGGMLAAAIVVAAVTIFLIKRRR